MSQACGQNFHQTCTRRYGYIQVNEIESRLSIHPLYSLDDVSQRTQMLLQKDAIKRCRPRLHLFHLQAYYQILNLVIHPSIFNTAAPQNIKFCACDDDSRFHITAKPVAEILSLPKSVGQNPRRCKCVVEACTIQLITLQLCPNCLAVVREKQRRPSGAGAERVHAILEPVIKKSL